MNASSGITVAARPANPRGVAWILAMLVGAALFIVALVPLLGLFAPSSRVSRYGRPASSADAPRLWFDGVIGPLGSATACFGRSSTTYPRKLPITAPDGRAYIVDVDHVRVDGNEVGPTLCLFDGRPVLVDGCISGERSIVSCDGLGIDVQPRFTLLGERERTIRESSWLIFLLAWLPLAFLGWSASRCDLGFRMIRRLTKRARYTSLRALVIGAFPPLALAVAACLLGAHPPPLALVVLLAIPTAILFSRARTLAGVIGDLTTSRSDAVVLEGTVGDRSTSRRAQIVDGASVAYGLVEISDTAGFGRTEIPTGGELEIVTSRGDFVVDAARVVSDLDVDAEVKLSSLQLPRELARVPFGSDEYRVRESVLRIGDPITALAPGSSNSPAIGRGAYRIAPRSAALSQRGVIVVFEGSKDEAVRRLVARRRRIDALTLRLLAIAVAATLWALEIGHLLRR